ncbi:unnamed protein product [Rhizophagus irregularis]|nr:unnamed protein product [Rhizophagus irregularis]
MEEDKYNEIVRNIDSEQHYRIKDGLLYRIENNKDLRVIRKYEFEGLMYIAHDHELSGHFGIEATYKRIKENCQRRGKPIGKYELNVIKVKEPFYQIGIDVVGPLPITERNNRYIVTAMDYFMKWPEARALETADAKEIARFIYEDIICRHGCPKKILSDRGTKLNNDKDWDLKVSGVLFAYRTKKNDSTKLKPGYLIYGREMKTLLNLEDENVTITQRINSLIEELPSIRNQAKGNIGKSQEKQRNITIRI